MKTNALAPPLGREPGGTDEGGEAVSCPPQGQGGPFSAAGVSVVAIDPGPVRSAICLYEEGLGAVMADTKPNAEVVALLRTTKFGPHWRLVIEKIACYGMPVGEEVFETCVWTGRFIEAWGERSAPERITRVAVKTHLCRSVRAADPNVRQALIDRFGGSAAIVKSKKCPRCKGRGGVQKPDGWYSCRNPECHGGNIGKSGPLAYVVGDQWAALAVAMTYADRVAGGYAG